MPVYMVYVCHSVSDRAQLEKYRASITFVRTTRSTPACWLKRARRPLKRGCATGFAEYDIPSIAYGSQLD